MTMNRRRHFIWLVLLLTAGLLLPITPVLADDGNPPGDDGIVIWNEDYTLEEGERLNGNLVVFNGDVTLEADSRVEGSVIIWNGSVEVEGVVDEDVVVSGGDIYLGADAHVKGNVVCSWNCDMERKEGARVEGVFTEGNPLGDLHIERVYGIPLQMPSPHTFWVSGPGQALRWALKFIRGVAAVLVVAAVAGLVALIWPHPTAQIGRTMIEAPWHSLGIGLLTVAAATMLIIVLTITICLAPVAALAALALGAAGLFGWIGIGAVVGERLLQALNATASTRGGARGGARGIAPSTGSGQAPSTGSEQAPLWAAGLGTLVITLIGAGLSEAFCLAPLGWLVISILGCLGLGAVVLTRFGATAYTPSTGSGQAPSTGSGQAPSTGSGHRPSPPPVEETESPEAAKVSFQ